MNIRLLDPVFDFRDIRPKGSRLITSGGKAPGADPLRICLDKLRSVLNDAIGRKLKPIEVHDMICHIADAVLSGGIRRAALISLFDKDDQVMLKAKGNFKVVSWEHLYVDAGVDEHGEPKQAIVEHNIEGTKYYDLKVVYEDYNGLVERELHFVSEYALKDIKEGKPLAWYFFHPQRGRANNSVVLHRDETTKEEWDDIWKKVEESGSGEPGVFWTNDYDMGTNPCAEIALNPNQYCNL